MSSLGLCRHLHTCAYPHKTHIIFNYFKTFLYGVEETAQWDKSSGWKCEDPGSDRQNTYKASVVEHICNSRAPTVGWERSRRIPRGLYTSQPGTHSHRQETVLQRGEGEH